MRTRRVWYGVLACVVAAALAVPGAAVAQMGGEVVIVTYGGVTADALREAYWKPFAAQTGIAVREESPPTIAKVRAMVDSGNPQWDIVEINLNWILSLRKAGDYLEKIPLGELPPNDVSALYPDAVNDYGIGAFYWAWALAYRTDVFPPNHRPHNWADFWNLQRFPGPRTLQDSPSSNLEFALLAAGKDPNHLYPLDVDLAFKKLDEIRSSIVKYWDTGALAPQLLANKEVFLGSVYSGRVKALQAQGIPVALEWNQALLDVDFWSIVKGARNYANAVKLIGFMMDPKRQAMFAELIPYGPVNQQAFKYISAAVNAELPSYPNNKKRMVRFNGEWWGPRLAELQERWQQWKLGGR